MSEATQTPTKAASANSNAPKAMASNVTNFKHYKSGMIDQVSFSYDRDRLRDLSDNQSYHQQFAAHLDAKIQTKLCSNIDSWPFLLSPLRGQSRAVNSNEAPWEWLHSDVADYARYDLFGDCQKLLNRLFHPAFKYGIRDIGLFRFMSRHVLHLQCVHDVGIDALNFLHATFIVVYWKEPKFTVQLTDTPMEGIIKLLQTLVPLSTCVWWLCLHRSLNRVNMDAHLPFVNFKNLLCETTERRRFHTNLITRLMAAGQQQCESWKQFYVQQKYECGSVQFLEELKRNKMKARGMTANDNYDHRDVHNHTTAFSQQLSRYVDQLMMPKMFIAAHKYTDGIQQQLLANGVLRSDMLKARQNITRSKRNLVVDYFASEDDEEDDQDVDLHSTKNRKRKIDDASETVSKKKQKMNK